jgi:hypothetical protein
MPPAELLRTKGALDASGTATPVTAVAHGLAVLPPDEIGLVSADAEGFHLRGSVRFHKIQLRPLTVMEVALEDPSPSSGNGTHLLLPACICRWYALRMG